MYGCTAPGSPLLEVDVSDATSHRAATFALRAPRKTTLCPRCNRREKSVEVIIQARKAQRPKPGALATRARRLCEPCALVVFEDMEKVLDG
jgi:NMD protein affecting ribosome stability and mRNA decay